ncbi:hypothetical protein [Campylobacter cuniculorum]|uniref:hypothetical protein n=1 Tax=Campylobacter cuniculorum TaxID=374106 RepID=UPI0023F042B8|nr:hypothetical protein [Campylobacter cuniculorum]
MKTDIFIKDINFLKKYEIDALNKALNESIEKAHKSIFNHNYEKVCYCTCLFANYFSNKLAKALSYNKICEILWIKIKEEFDYEIKDNLLSIVLNNSSIDRELFENIKTTYCKERIN